MGRLTLTRREHERIFVGDGIIIEVNRIGGSSVRLTVEAPDDMRIDREEVRKKIDAQKGGTP